MGAVFYLGLSTVVHCSTSARAIRLYALSKYTMYGCINVQSPIAGINIAIVIKVTAPIGKFVHLSIGIFSLAHTAPVPQPFTCITLLSNFLRSLRYLQETK